MLGPVFTKIVIYGSAGFVEVWGFWFGFRKTTRNKCARGTGFIRGVIHIIYVILGWDSPKLLYSGSAIFLWPGIFGFGLIF